MNKKMCVLSGNCHLSEVGQLTNLKGYNGEDIYTGDLVVVYGKEDLELSLEHINSSDYDSNEDFYFELFLNSLKDKTYSGKRNVVLKDLFSTYTSKSIVRESIDSGWVFGWRSSDMNEYHIFKIRGYEEVEDGFSHRNFRYEMKELEVKEIDFNLKK